MIYHIFSHKRGGGHLLHQWFLQMLPQGRTRYVQDILRTGSEKSIASAARRGYVHRHLSPKVFDHSVLGYEDRSISSVRGCYLITDDSDAEVRIILIRNIYNLIASRWAQQKDGHLLIPPHAGYNDFTEYWVDYVTQLMGEAYVVDFDTFVTDAHARYHLAAELELDDSNVDMDHVPNFGRGSSFDGRGTPGTQMKVTERYKQVPEEVLSRNISEEAAALNEKFCGWRLP